MGRIGTLVVGAVLAGAAALAHAAGFSFTFEWGDIPLCTTGSPNVVDNPRFALANVPPGTRTIEFRLVDLDVPSYPHGGGTVAYTGASVIAPGAFTYHSPCPPGEVHTYEWTATARSPAGVVATAKARRRYPE